MLRGWGSMSALSVKAVGNCLVVTAIRCLVAISAHTTYRHVDLELAADTIVSKALEKSWEELLDRHIQDYRRLFNQISLQLWPKASQALTNTWLEGRSKSDPGLVALYHDHDRYLLISNGRDGPNAIPAKLQGMWNDRFSHGVASLVSTSTCR